MISSRILGLFALFTLCILILYSLLFNTTSANSSPYRLTIDNSLYLYLHSDSQGNLCPFIR